MAVWQCQTAWFIQYFVLLFCFLKGGLLILDPFLYLDHCFFVKMTEAHCDDRTDPSKDRHAVIQGHGGPENSGCTRIAGLGHGGRIADQSNRAGCDRCAEGGNDLIDQAVYAGNNSRNITAAAVKRRIE